MKKLAKLTLGLALVTLFQNTTICRAVQHNSIGVPVLLDGERLKITCNAHEEGPSAGLALLIMRGANGNLLSPRGNQLPSDYVFHVWPDPDCKVEGGLNNCRAYESTVEDPDASCFGTQAWQYGGRIGQGLHIELRFTVPDGCDPAEYGCIGFYLVLYKISVSDVAQALSDTSYAYLGDDDEGTELACMNIRFIRNEDGRLSISYSRDDEDNITDEEEGSPAPPTLEERFGFSVF